MNNQEKAREIAEKNACDYPFKGGLTNTSRAECEDSALEMAEWKDQQFKEYLEKKAKEAKEKRDADTSFEDDWDEWSNRYWVYGSIIDELFEDGKDNQ